jgi:hypothetical protein
MPENPQNFTNDRSHEKLEPCSRKISKTPSRAESHCIGRNTENEISARDSRTTIAHDDNHIVRRNNEGSSSTAADARVPRRRRRRSGNRQACVNDHQPLFPESAGERQADKFTKRRAGMASAARAQNRHPPYHATANPARPLGRTHLKSTPLTRAAHPKSTDAPKTADNAPSGPILRIKLL